MQVRIECFALRSFTAFLSAQIKFFGAGDALDSIEVRGGLGASVELNSCISLYFSPFLQHFCEVPLGSDPFGVSLQKGNGVPLGSLAFFVVDIKHLPVGTVFALVLLHRPVARQRATDAPPRKVGMALRAGSESGRGSRQR